MTLKAAEDRARHQPTSDQSFVASLVSFAERIGHRKKKRRVVVVVVVAVVVDHFAVTSKDLASLTSACPLLSLPESNQTPSRLSTFCYIFERLDSGP